jgi:solute carrier family 25 S-adenosylmethionine transporter 26
MSDAFPDINSFSPDDSVSPGMMECSSSDASSSISLLQALLCGGFAGTTCDVLLYPIDTIKTRLQAPQGFFAAGGFGGLSRGLGAAAVGSAPGAALFFGVYETLKPFISSQLPVANPVVTHMIAAAAGETASCLVRVPTDTLKTKMQAGRGNETISSTLRLVLSEPGIFGGIYRGYGITLMREIPFALIQFPIYEWAKGKWSKLQGSPVTPLQAAGCGSIGGAIAAGLTTPLDVVRTRLLLGKDKHGVAYVSTIDVFRRIRLEEAGYYTFFSGIQPRIMWISIGGFLFFGAYETYKLVIPFHV